MTERTFICGDCHIEKPESERAPGKWVRCIPCRVNFDFMHGCATKVAYSTSAKACRALLHAAETYGVELHVYRCKFCNQFHMTKHAPRLKAS